MGTPAGRIDPIVQLERETSHVENESRKWWDEVVRLTGDLGDDVTGSLRIPLYVFLRDSAPLGWRKFCGNLASTARLFRPRRRQALPHAEKGRLLFCFAHETPSHVRNLLPVARESARRGLLGGIVCAENALPHVQEFAKAFPVVSANRLARQDGFVDQARAFRKSLAAFRQIRSAVKRSHPEWLARWQANRSRILREIATSVQMTRVFGELLSAWAPSGVVSTSDFWPLEYQMCRQAARARIPSVLVQHGTIGHFWWPFVADTYLLWGDFYRDQLAALGAPAESLRSCGMPATDDLFRAAQQHPALERPWREPPVCLILSHTHGRSLEAETFARFGKLLQEVLPATPQFRWKVKLHPSEDDAFYRELGGAIYSRLEFHPRSVSLEETIQDCDIAMTVFSTSALEAMILRRPVVVLGVTAKGREYGWWPQQGGGVYAGTPEELLGHLSRLVQQDESRAAQLETQQRFLDRCFASPRRAAESVVDCLEELQGSSRPARAAK